MAVNENCARRCKDKAKKAHYNGQQQHLVKRPELCPCTIGLRHKLVGKLMQQKSNADSKGSYYHHLQEFRSQGESAEDNCKCQAYGQPGLEKLAYLRCGSCSWPQVYYICPSSPYVDSMRHDILQNPLSFISFRDGSFPTTKIWRSYIYFNLYFITPQSI